ncbi:2TM domain-containing protein [Flavilitoribacter nigricans]|uniref:2TM domain-containing protein n=1 Tax=Flavilitoribacter nigricans (strain ATCC 23147 / DSM 23189 / NBRC 102662 / NCIMB 1420 / SS-2) TaxID=1122177 RepID=A0A2D0N752_FLAN2|nr:2TM domain-containing protein [Flavilitoribacter nigricans]PHN04216.1 hypothetical protein CRP01_21895 [Flavilitoribacter nigricans DSM 23189 = NBRC 102662]
MCQRNQDRYSRRKQASEKIKFYRHLRSFIIFNIIMAGLWVAGSGLAGLWAIARIWGIFVAVHYIKVNGLPGTKGWLSKDWEDWMEAREKRRWDNEPETIVDEPFEMKQPQWRERDLV